MPSSRLVPENAVFLVGGSGEKGGDERIPDSIVDEDTIGEED